MCTLYYQIPAWAPLAPQPFSQPPASHHNFYLKPASCHQTATTLSQRSLAMLLHCVSLWREGTAQNPSGERVAPAW